MMRDKARCDPSFVSEVEIDRNNTNMVAIVAVRPKILAIFYVGKVRDNVLLSLSRQPEFTHGLFFWSSTEEDQVLGHCPQY
jgi:hypothetical protein